MVTVGMHAAHELYAPSELLDHLKLGEESGFSTAMCSDHFYPWTPSQGHSGHSFTWLAAALARTCMSMGTICYPCGRYHPAVLAQTAATLSEMFPDRFWLALGTGEAMNESITGEPWPAKQQRREMVEQSAQALRALWAGEQVNCDGLITIRNARLYTRSTRPPKLFGAATTAETATWIGRWADGLLTTGSEHEELRRLRRRTAMVFD